MERKEKIAGKKIVALISIWYIAFHAKYCNAQFQEDNRTIPYQVTSRQAHFKQLLTNPGKDLMSRLGVCDS